MASEFSWSKILGEPGPAAPKNVPPPLNPAVSAEAPAPQQAAPAPAPVQATPVQAAPVQTAPAQPVVSAPPTPQVVAPVTAAPVQPQVTPPAAAPVQVAPPVEQAPAVPAIFTTQPAPTVQPNPVATAPIEPVAAASEISEVPLEEVYKFAPKKPEKAEKHDMAIDPRTGMVADSEAPVYEIVTKPSALGAESDSEQARINYRPALVDQSVHQIDVVENKFEQLDIMSQVTQRESDALDVSEAHIDDILRMAIERKASDIHITQGLPPMMRLDGEVVPLPYTILTAEDTRRLVYDTLSDDQVQKYENTHELDFAYMIKGLARFRFNVYMQRGSVTGALRVIPTKIPSFDQLGLPPVIREMAKRASGLILVTGPTGSGKSTTIASMIDDINETRQAHIITIEDPIEYLHRHKKCMVNQREMHADTYSFHNALRAVLREDPDIILVGELRDLETIEAALTMAETGHLVFGTLHTRNAPSTIDRIIDVFPSDQQSQIRVLLGNTLEGVVSQQLIPKLGGGRCAAIEIMLGSPAIKNLIREGKTHQMYSSIETGTQMGMQTMDSSLANHFRNGYCSFEELMMRAVDKETFSRLARNAA